MLVLLSGYFSLRACCVFQVHDESENRILYFGRFAYVVSVVSVLCAICGVLFRDASEARTFERSVSTFSMGVTSLPGGQLSALKTAKLVFKECFEFDFVLEEMLGVDSSAQEFLVCSFYGKLLCHSCCDVLS